LTKVISLSEDAYLRLKRKKGEGESFSDVGLGLTSAARVPSLLEPKASW
jgi:predicted CopG family antitoxin